MSHKLAVVTVVYKNYSILKDFFDSFEKQTRDDFTIFVVDLTESVSFTHGVAEWIPRGWESWVKILKGENKGYAHGINVGLKKAIKDGYDFFVVINSDTYVAENFIENVFHHLNDERKTIIGGKIYYAQKFEYHKNRYSKNDLRKVIWYAGGSIDWKNVIGFHRGVDEVDRSQYDTFEKTDFITGCLMLFDKSIIEKVGYFDESYFLYYEDADFCERAKRSGISLYYDPSIIIWHKNAQSTGGSGSKLHQKYQQKNRLKFGLKYAPWRTKAHLLKNLMRIR